MRYYTKRTQRGCFTNIRLLLPEFAVVVSLFMQISGFAFYMGVHMCDSLTTLVNHDAMSPVTHDCRVNAPLSSTHHVNQIKSHILH